MLHNAPQQTKFEKLYLCESAKNHCLTRRKLADQDPLQRERKINVLSLNKVSSNVLLAENINSSSSSD
jgi:hypothetical protein